MQEPVRGPEPPLVHSGMNSCPCSERRTEQVPNVYLVFTDETDNRHRNLDGLLFIRITQKEVI